MCIFSLSVSESQEWVCTKTVFSNGTIVRGCEKTYTGKPRSVFIYHCLCRYLVSACNQINKPYMFAGGETISICFWSDDKGEGGDIAKWQSTRQDVVPDAPQKCLCSAPLCNSSGYPGPPPASRLGLLSILQLLSILLLVRCRQHG